MLKYNEEKEPIFGKKTQQMFLLFMLFAALLASASVLSYVIFFPDKTAEVTLNNAVKKNKERESVIKGFTTDSALFLQTLANSNIFKNYLKSKSNEDELKRVLLILLQSQKDFMQIRYIDKHGVEEIRVDRDRKSKKTFVIPDNELQNKSDRYYFANSKQKPLGKVWFSAIDLNMENGKIEVPYKPTLRAILPLSIDGKFGGIIIVNYYIERFLKKLLYMPLYDVVLLDGDGYPLINYKKDKSWGFYKKDKYNISEQFPMHSKKILSNSFYKSKTMTSKKV